MFNSIFNFQISILCTYIVADRKNLPRINFGLEAARVIHNELDIYEVDTFYLFYV